VQIDWDIRTPLEDRILTKMQNVAELCKECEQIRVPCKISICLCDDETIAELNRDYRNTDRSTDVLSFPSVSYPHGKTAGECEALLKQEYDDISHACFLGDVIISVPHVILQAKEFGHSLLRESVYLMVHGICHLMGYDHIQSEDKKKMRMMEDKIMSAASIERERTFSDEDYDLLRLAKEAMKNSYSPYSSYPVGAALRCTDGRIFQGCNIENASFGLTNCAERTAVFKAVSEGAKSFDAIAIAAGTKAWPCGACRQVLNEFSPHMRVLVTWDENIEEKKLHDLLPEGFGPDSMHS